MFAFGCTNVCAKPCSSKHELNVVHLEPVMMAFKIASVDIASRHNIAPKTVEIPSHPFDIPAHVHAPNLSLEATHENCHL
jgi:hypothetical protein